MEVKCLGQNENSARYKVRDGDQWLSFQEIFELWQGSPEFRNLYRETLAAKDFEAFFWEHPGLHAGQTGAPYEFILHRSRNLSRLKPDPAAFQDHFQDGQSVAVFPNLGRNAILLAPNQLGETEHYPHFAQFLRSPLEEQQHALFQQLGSEILERLQSDQTTWISTAGMGVPWLHIRLDQRPKYYRSKRYRDPGFLQQ